MIDSWSDEQRDDFEREGFLVVEEGFIGDEAIELLRGRFERLFAADYETGLDPALLAGAGLAALGAFAAAVLIRKQRSAAQASQPVPAAA